MVTGGFNKINGEIQNSKRGLIPHFYQNLLTMNINDMGNCVAQLYGGL